MTRLRSRVRRPHSSPRVLCAVAAILAAGVAVPSAAAASGPALGVAACDVVGTLRVGPPVRDASYDWSHTRDWQIDGQGTCLDGLHEWTVSLHGFTRVEYFDGTASTGHDSVGICGAVPTAHVTSSPTGVSGAGVDATWSMPVEVELSNENESIAVDQEWTAFPSTLVGPNPFTIDGGAGGVGVLTTRIFAKCDGDPKMRAEFAFPL